VAAGSPKVRDDLVRPRDETVHAAEEVVIVAHSDERLCAASGTQQRELQVQAPELTQGQQLALVAETFDGDGATVTERLVGEQVLAGELRGLDAGERLQRLLLDRQPVGQPRLAHVVAEAVVPAMVALRGRSQWIELEVLVEVSLGDVAQLLPFTRGPLRLARGLCGDGPFRRGGRCAFAAGERTERDQQ
jgi:hypothetical protein